MCWKNMTWKIAEKDWNDNISYDYQNREWLVQALQPGQIKPSNMTII